MKSLNQLYLCAVLSIFSAHQANSSETSIDRSLQEQTMLSVLYAQSSTEYAANCIQTYANASQILDTAIADKKWTAALEQTGEYSEKPMAIILDVDETVLDLSLIHISEPTRLRRISYAVFCLKKKKK